MILPFLKEQLTECDTKNETNYNNELHPVVAVYPTVFSFIFHLFCNPSALRCRSIKSIAMAKNLLSLLLTGLISDLIIEIIYHGGFL